MSGQGKRAIILAFEYDPETGERCLTPNRKGGRRSRIECGSDLVRYAEDTGADPAALLTRYDEALPFVPDLFERYRRMLERLDDPLYLDEAHRASLTRYLTQGRQVACEVFAKHDYVRGVDSLVAHGIVNASDLAVVVDRLAGNPRTVTAMARLLELKRRIASSQAADYEL